MNEPPKEIIIDGYPVRDWGYSTGGWPSSYRPLKLLLLELNGVCYWCKQTVYDHPRVEGIPDPDDTATIDHIESRFTRQKGSSSPKVLSCQRCNQKRAREAEKQFVKQAQEWLNGAGRLVATNEPTMSNEPQEGAPVEGVEEEQEPEQA